jgi:lysozyme
MIPEPLLALIRKYEGLRLEAYLCPAGVPTIGYGQTGADVQLGVVWTLEQAEARLRIAAEGCIGEVCGLCPQIAGDMGKTVALADFVYNLGRSRLAGSTLLRLIKKGNYPAAANEFPKWVRCGAKKLPGLVARRAEEQRLFLGT